jgi:lysine 6-dehydrogenase
VPLWLRGAFVRSDMLIDYLVLGAGRQGTAAAYDLVKFGEADRVTLADRELRIAQAAADRVNQLTGRSCAAAIALDVRDEQAVRAALRDRRVVLSAVPYYFNLPLTYLAIESGASWCDLGGHTDIVRQQHALHEDAQEAGVSVVPDCGMGPGLGNTLGVYAMELLDTTEHVYLFDGGLPLDPQPPWNYIASFNIEGLTNEYYDGMTILRGGELVHVPVFSELEIIDTPLGPLEAFMVAGGVSTAPWTFKGQLQTYQLKIVRYPGTFAQLKAFSDLGLFNLDPVRVDGHKVVPRQVFHALFEPQVRAEVVKDVCLIRAQAIGTKDGQATKVTIDLVDRYDPITGFSAMERTTGWHLSIVASLIAHGQVAPGALPLERAVPGHAFVEEAQKRGFNFEVRYSDVGQGQP